MRTLLTKTALTVGFALAMAFTFSCSGDDGGGDNNPGTGTPSSSDNGGSSSGGSSSSGGGSSSGGYVCPEWEWKITTPATCETSQTTGRAKETETCRANQSITKGEPREILNSELEWGKWKLVGGVGKRCCQDDPNSICETSNELQACGSELYAPSLQFCQAGTNEVKERCGTATFTSTEFCQSPNVVKPLCGTEEYTSAEFCQAGTNAVLPLCGTATFTSTEFCQSPNVVKPLCGTDEYTSSQFCQAGTNAVLPLCGTATFTSTEFCQAGTDAVLPLCGSLPYEATQFCHNSKIGDFCGTRTETFDPDLYECKTGDKIYLKSGLTDSRDNNKHYEAVLIGTQTWMAENLNYAASGSKCGSVLTGSGTLNDANTPTCDRYGRLYNWATALAINASCNATTVASCGATISPKHQGLCPSGWHIPSNAEWNVLMRFVNPSCTDNSTCAGAGKILKADSPLWNSNGKGTDDFGFAALPGGNGNSDGDFDYVGYYGLWWSSSEDVANYAYYRNMYYSYEYADYNDYTKSNLFSVRCLQDSP